MCMHVVITLTIIFTSSLSPCSTHTHTSYTHTHSPQMEVLKEGYLTQQGSFQVLGDIQSGLFFFWDVMWCVYVCKLITAAAQINCSGHSLAQANHLYTTVREGGALGSQAHVWDGLGDSVFPLS